MFKLKLSRPVLFSRAKPLAEDVKVLLAYSAKVLKKHRGAICGVSILKALSFPLGLFIVYITKITLDKGILGKDLALFVRFTALGLLAFFLMRGLRYAANRISQAVRAKFSLDVNYDLTKRLFGLSYFRIKELSSAENTFILDYDYQVIENLTFDEFPSLISLVKIPVIFMLISLFSLPLALLVLVSLPLVALHTVWASRKKKKYKAEEIFHSRKYYSRLHDTLLNIKLVKSLFKEDWALERVISSFRGKVDRSLRTSMFFHKSRFVSDLFLKLNTALFCLLGGYFVIKGRLSFGSFGAVSMYTALIVSEIYSVSRIAQGLNEEAPSIKRSAAFIREITGERKKASLLRAAGDEAFEKDIRFRNVSFGYKKDKMLFSGLSFTLPARKWTLIRGPSGVGKTTLLSLFLRLFHPREGSIFIGDGDIKLMERNSFSGNVSAVHQEPYLFNDTLMNNILLGEDRNAPGVEKALFSAKTEDLAGGLFFGYNSPVGESGSTLSGGERQRIAIARALVREPKILILDEATSFVDSGMEQKILENIKNFFPSTTVIFVTHRDTAKKFADEILVLQDGRIFKEDKIPVN